MKQGKKSILILSLFLFIAAIPKFVCSEWLSLNNESWQSLKPGRYNNESWQSLAPGTYLDKSWQAQKPGRYDDKSWQALTPGTYIDNSWRMKEIPCSKSYTKKIRPQATSVGSTMAIRGNGFGGDPGEVLFNKDVPAEIVSWSNRYIEVLVPEGATTGDVKIVKTCPSGTFGASQQIEIENPLSE